MVQFSRKTAYVGGNFDYHGFLQNPEEDWLKEQCFFLFKTQAPYRFTRFSPKVDVYQNKISRRIILKTT